MIELLQAPNIRISLKLPDGRIKSILSLSAGRDGSCYLKCPKKYFPADKHHFGVLDMSAGVRYLSTANLDESRGFVVTNEEAKISFHPSGYIQASLSSKETIALTRQVDMGVPLRELNSKTVAMLRWHEIDNFVDNLPRSKSAHHVNVALPSLPRNIMAFLKVGSGLQDFGEIKFVLDGEKLDVPNELPESILSSLEDGNFLILKTLFLDQNSFNIVDTEAEHVHESVYPLTGLIFAIREREGNLIWYRLSFFHPLDTPQTARDDQPGFMFCAAYKNWEEEKIRETGQQVILLGRKN